MKQTEQAKVYVTLSDGQDFRNIAKMMSEHGYQMNHATARNVLIAAMTKLLSAISADIGVELTAPNMAGLLKNQEVHDVLADVLYSAHHLREASHQP